MTVAGYTTVRELGRGASGAVELARHDESGVLVAVKELDPALSEDAEFLAGFRAEARLLGEVDDPNVARFYEYVQQGSKAWIVLEFVDGVPLRALLDEQAPLTPEAALAVMKGSLLGLAAAHEHGVVHRDYKPENVLVTPVGTTRLVDFGIAVRAGRDAPAAGTPHYMAPEQWAGGAASPGSDVYAATCVLVEAVTGRRAFDAPSTDGLRRQHANAPVPLAGLPDALHGLVRKGLAKDPSKRPHDARALTDDLERVARAAYGEDWEARGRQELRRLVLLLAALLPAGGTAAAGGLAAFARTVLGRGRWAALGLAGAVLVGGTAAATTTGRSVRRADSPASFATATAHPVEPGRPASGAPRSSAPPSPATSARPPRRPSRSSSTAPATTAPSPVAGRSTPTVHRSPRRPGSTGASRSTAPRPRSSSVAPPPAPLSLTIVKGKTRIDQASGTTDATVSVSIQASDGRPFTVDIEYSDGSGSSFTESGSTYYAIQQTHTFPSCGNWSMTVTTQPAAANSPYTYSVSSSC